MTKEELLHAIRQCARKLGRNPRLRELRRFCALSESQLYREFGNLARALRAAGLEPQGPGFAIAPGDLLLDWAAVARKLGKLPTVADYAITGRFSQRPFLARYGHWSRIQAEFRKFAREQGSEAEWGDVLAMTGRGQARPAPYIQASGSAANSGVAREADVTKHAAAGGCAPGLFLTAACRDVPQRFSEGRQVGPPAESSQKETILTLSSTGGRRAKSFLLRDRPVYGPPLPLLLPALAHEPVNEAGVIYVFGLLAERLGFVVQRVQTDFPDCEAMREMEKGRWQRVRIEFEFESRNFVKHGHRGQGCDLIVCWVHNWPECPQTIEVIELRRMVRTLSA